nr:tetratricopeptide repeat protein [Candidatus Sigynarchaeum springense]
MRKDSDAFNEGMMALARGDIGVARLAFQQAIKENPDNDLAWSGLGTILTATRDFRGAIDAMQQALRLNPGNAQTWYNMGLVKEMMRDVSGARDAFRKSMELDPSKPIILWKLGPLLGQTNDLRGAIDVLRRAAQLDPKNARGLYNLGYALELSGEIKAAMDVYENVLRLDPSVKMAADRINILKQQVTTGGDRVKIPQRESANPPSNHEDWFRLAVSQHQAGDIASAIASIDEAIRLSPDNDRHWYHKGVFLIAAKRVKDAQACFNKANELKPSQPHTMFNLASSCIETGDLPRARALFQLVLAIDPSQRMAAVAIERIDAAMNSPEYLRMDWPGLYFGTVPGGTTNAQRLHPMTVVGQFKVSDGSVQWLQFTCVAFDSTTGLEVRPVAGKQGLYGWLEAIGPASIGHGLAMTDPRHPYALAKELYVNNKKPGALAKYEAGLLQVMNWHMEFISKCPTQPGGYFTATGWPGQTHPVSSIPIGTPGSENYPSKNPAWANLQESRDGPPREDHLREDEIDPSNRTAVKGSRGIEDRIDHIVDNFLVDLTSKIMDEEAKKIPAFMQPEARVEHDSGERDLDASSRLEDFNILDVPFNQPRQPSTCPDCQIPLGFKSKRRCKKCGLAWCLNCGTWNEAGLIRCKNCQFVLPSD